MNDNKSPMVCPACGSDKTQECDKPMPYWRCMAYWINWKEPNIAFLRSRITELEAKCEAMSAAMRQIYGIAAEY